MAEKDLLQIIENLKRDNEEKDKKIEENNKKLEEKDKMVEALVESRTQTEVRKYQCFYCFT